MTNRLKPAETYTHTHTHTHTCSLLLSFLSIFIFSSPSYSSGISSNANSASCDNSTLEKYTGTSNLTAGWTGNHIDLYWYADSEATTPMTVASESQDCTYGGSLTPPAASSMVNLKPGYTFRGWRVRQAAQCNLASLNANIDGIWYASRDANDCYYEKNNTDEWSENCNDSYFNGLNSWEWTANFSYGTIKGMAKCSTKVGNNNHWNYDNNSSNWTATDSEIMSTQNGAYCWCKATSYTPNGSSSCTLNNSSWVLFDPFGGDVSDCMANCWFSCAGSLIASGPGETGYPNYRSTFFSVQ